MSDNARGAMERLNSIWFDMRVALGDGLLPVLVALIDRVIPLIGAAGEWFEANQELVTSVGWVVAGLLALNIAVLVAQWGFWLLFGWVGKLRIAVGALIFAKGCLARNLMVLALRKKVATIATLAFANAITWLLGMAVLAWWGLRGLMGILLALGARALALGAAGIRAVAAALLWLARSIARAGLLLLKNPLFLAIAAIGAAVYLIYANWDNIVSYFTDKFDRVKEAFQSGFLNGLAQLIAAFNILTMFLDMIEGVLSYLGSAFDIDLFSQGAAMIASLRDGIYSVLTGMVASVRDYLSSIVPDWLINAWNHVSGGGGDAPAGDTRTRRSGRDSGGVVRPGFLYEINERGQEFFAPDRPGSVIKGSDLHCARANSNTGAAGDTITINLYGADGGEDVVRKIERFFEDRARRKRYSLHDGSLA